MKYPELCEKIAPDLKAHLDGELGFWRCQTVSHHLKNCSNCQKELELMQNLSKNLREDSAPLDAELRERILQNAPQPTPISVEEIARQRRRTKKKLVLALGGATFAALFAANLAMQAPAPTQDSGETLSVAQNTTEPNVLKDAKLSQRNVNGSTAYDRLANNSQAELESRTYADVNKSARKEKTRIDGANFAAADGQVKWQRGGDSTAVAGAASATSLVPQERAVHREGSLTVGVENAEKAGDGVEEMVKNVGGFVATTSLETGTDGRRAAMLDVRVPVEKFETIVAKISELGLVQEKKINGEDVTARIAKAGARKETLSNEMSIREAQLKKKEAASKKGDATSTYYLRREVRELRVRAAEAKAQLAFLQKYSDASSLFVTLRDNEEPKPAAGWTSGFGATGATAWQSFLDAAKLPVQLLIWILAYSPLWIPALIIWRKWGRKWVEA